MMEKTTLFYSCVLLFGVFISAISQVLLKKAAMEHHSSIIEEYLNPKVIIAYMIFFGATLLSIYAYKGIPLSMGPVLESTSYIYVTVFGVKIFHESLNRRKVIAIALIICGILVYSFV